jgi:hypothetical protein
MKNKTIPFEIRMRYGPRNNPTSYSITIDAKKEEALQRFVALMPKIEAMFRDEMAKELPTPHLKPLP